MKNRVELIGNLGRDADIHITPSGLHIANLSVATNEQWTDAEGKPQKHTEWHRIVAFRKLAEMCADMYTKGKQVLVEGKLRTRRWEDKDGVTRYTTEVIAQNMRLLGAAPAGSGSGVPPAPSPEAYEALGDIPF